MLNYLFIMKIQDQAQCPNCNKFMNANTAKFSHSHMCQANQQNETNEQNNGDREDIVNKKLNTIDSDTEQKKTNILNHGWLNQIKIDLL